MTRRRKSVLAALTLAALVAVTGGRPAPADALTCQIRQHRQKRVCWCWDGRWVTAPMALCRVVQ